MTREQVKEKVYKKKVKRALKIARLRPLKNFLFWFAGVLSSIAIVAGSIFVAVKIVPIGTYVGKENATEYVSEDIANKSFLDAILEINNYGFSDLPIVENTLRDFLNDGDLGKYLDIDFEKLNAIRFSDEEMGSAITGSLKIIATIDSLDVSLGDFGEISSFTDFEKIPVDAEDYPILTTDEDGVKKLDTETCNAKLYYYIAETGEDSGAAPLTEENPIEPEQPEEPEDTNVYKRVFDDDGYFTSDELASKSYIEYYYPAVTKVPILEAFDIIDESLGRLTVVEMIETMGGKSEGEDNLMEKIFGDKKVSELDSFSESDIKLSAVLEIPTEENEYKNKNLYDVILQSTTDENVTCYEDLTVASLDGMDGFDNVNLSTVLDLPTEDNEYKNQKIYDILTDSTGKTAEEMTVSDLSSFSTDNIKLSTVIEDTDSKIFTILSGAITDDQGNPKDKNELTVSDLSDDSFKTENILLKDVLDLATDNKLYKILCDASGKPYEEIKVGTLGGNESEFSINNVKLSNILDNTDNAILSVLLKGDSTVGSLATDITSLSLYEVYGEECFKPYDMPGVEFIGTNTWFAKEEVDTDSDGIVDHFAFVHEDDSYFVAHPTAVKYGLCKNDGIWLLLCFDGIEFEDTEVGGVLVDTDGRPEKYVISDRTLGDLETDASALSDSFKGATVRQLIDAGIVPDGSYNERMYTLSLVETVQELSDAFDEIDNATNP